MEFIETSVFTKLVFTYLSDDEYLGLQVFLFKYSEAGKIVPGSGGSENCDGQSLVKANEAASKSFTTSRNKETR